MEMNYYNVVVKLVSVRTGDPYEKTISFKSKYGARYMAREYAKCIDVLNVDVVDATTGEVIISFKHGKCIWDVEG